MTLPKRLFTIAVIAILLAAPFGIARSSDYLPKDPNNSGIVTVGGSEEFRNLYVGGGSVAVNKQILGDLFAAGGSIHVAGSVEKDLFAGGGNITISNPIGEDARVAGGNITFSAGVGGDLLVAGGTVTISQGADIGGDLWAGAGILNLNSNVQGEARIAGGEILINGEVARDLHVRADERLVFGPQSRVAGKITFYGPREAVVQDGAQIGTIEFHRIERTTRAPAAKALGTIFFVKLLATLLVGLVILKLYGKTSQAIVSTSYSKPWLTLGVGTLGCVVTPIVVLIFLVTLVGAYAGIILVSWFVLMLMVASIFEAMFLGALVERVVFKKKEITLTWKTLVWGMVVCSVLSFIPVAGWLALTVAYLMTFGAILMVTRERFEM